MSAEPGQMAAADVMLTAFALLEADWDDTEAIASILNTVEDGATLVRTLVQAFHGFADFVEQVSGVPPLRDDWLAGQRAGALRLVAGEAAWPEG